MSRNTLLDVLADAEPLTAHLPAMPQADTHGSGSAVVASRGEADALSRRHILPVPLTRRGQRNWSAVGFGLLLLSSAAACADRLLWMGKP